MWSLSPNKLGWLLEYSCFWLKWGTQLRVVARQISQSWVSSKWKLQICHWVNTQGMQASICGLLIFNIVYTCNSLSGLISGRNGGAPWVRYTTGKIAWRYPDLLQWHLCCIKEMISCPEIQYPTFDAYRRCPQPNHVRTSRNISDWVSCCENMISCHISFLAMYCF